MHCAVAAVHVTKPLAVINHFNLLFEQLPIDSAYWNLQI